MFMTIYDYANCEQKIVLPNKKIVEIDVLVVTGDETGFVRFEDGTKINFDASHSRITDFIDGRYTVEGEDIEKWLNFKPSGKRITISYERQEAFDCCE